MVSSGDLDPSLFPFQDMRYKGNRGGNTGTKPKQKKGSKPATTFVKPLAPVQSGVSVSNSGGIGAVRGEKDKPKMRATPSPSPVRGGAVGGKVKGDSLVGGDSTGGPPNRNAATDSVVKSKAPIGGKGECILVVIV